MSSLLLSVALAANTLLDPSTILFDQFQYLDCASNDTFQVEADTDRFRFWVIFDSTGRLTHLYRKEDTCAPGKPPVDPGLCARTPSPFSNDLWAKAEPATSRPAVLAACGDLIGSQQDSNSSPILYGTFVGGVGEHAVYASPLLRVKLQIEGRKSNVGACRDLLLFASSGTSRILLTEDPCRPGDQDFTESAQFDIQGVVSPSNDRLAFSVVAERFAPTKKSINLPSEHISRGRLILVDHKTFLEVDLLDAGVGPQIETLTNKLSKAGYRIAHRGVAQTSRTSIHIYYAKGFEADAVSIGKLLDAPPEGIQPLTWRSPYPITVAAGGKQASP